MSSNNELRRIFEELQQLRASAPNTSLSHTDQLVAPVTEIAQKQLLYLQTINDFFKVFVEESVLKTRMEATTDCVVMPTRESALDFIETTNAAVEIHNEVVGLNKTDLNGEKALIENYKKTLNRLTSSNLNNQDFNRCFRGVIGHFNGHIEGEDFTDSTVNTIVSEDVLASSPF